MVSSPLSSVASFACFLSLAVMTVAPCLGRQSPAQTPATQVPQQPKPPPGSTQNQEEVIRLSSRLVLVPVSVSDAGGRPVRDLTADNFIIEEDGRPQKIVPLGEPGKTPIDIALLFDISSSVQGQFEFEQQAAVRFIKEVLKPSDAVTVFSIGSTPKLVTPRTAKGEEAIRGLMAIAPLKEATAFFDTIVEAALYLGRSADPGSRRVLVVISDGEENYSIRHAANDALRELQKNDCLFYSINPTGPGIVLNTVSLKGQASMESMSSQTGGKAFVPERMADLEAVFRQIAEELQAQYLFGYYSSDERADGGFRRISVRAKRQDLRVRARQGYYALKPES